MATGNFGMIRSGALLAIVSFFTFADQCVLAQVAAKHSAPVFKPNIEFAVVGGKSLRLNAHLPAGETPTPAIVLLHGGGFTGGAKGGYTGELARHLAQKGYAAFDIDYRLMGDLGPGATLPQAMKAAQEDLDRAVKHVVANSRNYGIDPNRLAVGGGSAGAITALLAAYGEDRVTSKPKAVVSLWGGMYGQERATKAGDPPVLLVHGTADKTVPFVMSESIAAASRKAGVNATLLRIENGGHTLPLNQTFQGRTINESVTEFLDVRLK
jgi:acetyl esterase/lipase